MSSLLPCRPADTRAHSFIISTFVFIFLKNFADFEKRTSFEKRCNLKLYATSQHTKAGLRQLKPEEEHEQEG